MDLSSQLAQFFWTQALIGHDKCQSGISKGRVTASERSSRCSSASLPLRRRPVLGSRLPCTTCPCRSTMTPTALTTVKTPIFTPPKTKAGIRTLPLPNLVVAELLLHLSQYPTGPAGLLFTTPTGTVLNQNNWRRREWNRARMWAYGVPRDVTFHRLRHTYASLLIDADVHPKALQVRLGHASAAETMDTYGHLYPDTDSGTREAIDTAFRVASNVAENVAYGFHHGRRNRRNRRSRHLCEWGAWDSNPQPTVKSPCSYIPVQMLAGYRIHLIPFHPDSSPRLYRPTPCHTTPSRAPRSPPARHRILEAPRALRDGQHRHVEPREPPRRHFVRGSSVSWFQSYRRRGPYGAVAPRRTERWDRVMRQPRPGQRGGGGARDGVVAGCGWYPAPA